MTAGEPVIGGLGSGLGRHHHCPDCKSWVFTRVEEGPGFVNVRATQLDDVSWFRPFVEMYTSEQLPWAHTDAPRRYPWFPPGDAWPALIADYAEFAAQAGLV